MEPEPGQETLGALVEWTEKSPAAFDEESGEFSDAKITRINALCKLIGANPHEETGACPAGKGEIPRAVYWIVAKKAAIKGKAIRKFAPCCATTTRDVASDATGSASEQDAAGPTQKVQVCVMNPILATTSRIANYVSQV